jgi:hypothetical protein
VIIFHGGAYGNIWRYDSLGKGLLLVNFDMLSFSLSCCNIRPCVPSILNFDTCFLHQSLSY